MKKIETLTQKMRVLCPVTKFESGNQYNKAAWEVLEQNNELVLVFTMNVDRRVNLVVLKNGVRIKEVKHENLLPFIESCELEKAKEAGENIVILFNAAPVLSLPVIKMKRQKLFREI